MEKDPDELHPLADESRVYRAFRGKRTGGGRSTSVLFVPNKGTHMRRLQLAHVQLADTAFAGTEIIMEFVHQTVVIEGRNLLALEMGIAGGWVSTVEAFSSERHDLPSQTSQEPFVQRIRFHLKDDELTKGSEANGQAQHLIDGA